MMYALVVHMNEICCRLSFGNPCLMEGWVKKSVLLKLNVKQNKMDYIRLGDHIVEYSKDFKFYITSRMRNPHYLPEVSDVT